MKLNKALVEGPHDPHRRKAIFMLGTPGSGKTTVARKLIGGSGLKMLSSDTAYEWLTMRGDDPIVGKGYDDDLYKHSGRLVQKQMKLWSESRLGLLIDATGRSVDRLLTLKSYLENVLGYETMAVYVTTDLATALNRNEERPRKVDSQWIRNVHRVVDQNVRRFREAFGRNFITVDNPEGANIDDIVPYKEVYAFLNRAPMTESIVNDEYGIRLREVVEIIRRRAQPWMYGWGFRNLDKPFYRGLLTPSDDAVRIGNLGFVATVRDDRTPLHSPKVVHDFFNEIISEAGGTANRSNSLFITSLLRDTKIYGKPHVIIPLGEYRYTWANYWMDWYSKVENVLYSSSSMVAHIEQDSPKVRKLREELLKDIRIDTGLQEAYQQGSEVMVACKEALYLEEKVWADIAQYYPDGLQK